VATGFEDLRVLKVAETIADSIWNEVVRWDKFARDVVGGQLARAADSIGANIAESYGRFHYGEKLQFLYYSRGSLFETKYWLNRCLERGLMKADQVNDFGNRLTDVARQLNTFAASLKTQRKNANQGNSVRETVASYGGEDPLIEFDVLFTAEDLNWLQSSAMEVNL
jgi:four helix bundle protein